MSHIIFKNTAVPDLHICLLHPCYLFLFFFFSVFFPCFPLSPLVAPFFGPSSTSPPAVFAYNIRRILSFFVFCIASPGPRDGLRLERGSAISGRLCRSADSFPLASSARLRPPPLSLFSPLPLPPGAMQSCSVRKGICGITGTL